jgi:hypothetical protein
MSGRQNHLLQHLSQWLLHCRQIMQALKAACHVGMWQCYLWVVPGPAAAAAAAAAAEDVDGWVSYSHYGVVFVCQLLSSQPACSVSNLHDTTNEPAAVMLSVAEQAIKAGLADFLSS